MISRYELSIAFTSSDVINNRRRREKRVGATRKLAFNIALRTFILILGGFHWFHLNDVARLLTIIEQLTDPAQRWCHDMIGHPKKENGPLQKRLHTNHS
jgi:hypothetical protein